MENGENPNFGRRDGKKGLGSIKGGKRESYVSLMRSRARVAPTLKG